MTRVRRDEILDWVTYSEQRDALRAAAMAAKDVRRVVIGDGTLTLLFENHDTIRYQILEMIRAERIVREADIQHEIDTYNELLGDNGELGATLLVGIDDEAQRDAKLRAWIDLPARLWLRMPDGSLVRPRHDARQVGEQRLSSVQYLVFDTGGRVPIAAGCDHPDLVGEVALDAGQRDALAADLGAT